MDNNIHIKNANPQVTANIFSRLLFVWFAKLCKKCTTDGLKIQDLFESLYSDRSGKLCNKLEKYWNDEIIQAKNGKNSQPSLLRAIRKTFISLFMFYGIILFLQFVIIRPLQPVLLSIFIGLFFPNNQISAEDNLNNMYLFGSLLVISTFVVLFLYHHTNLMITKIGMQIRIACSSLVYRKLLKLNQDSLKKSGAGQIVNLLSNDVSRFDLVVVPLHFFWIMPFQVVIVTYFIWKQVNVAAFVGVGSLFLTTIPVYAFVGKLSSRFRSQIAIKTDSRVKKMAEIVSGIQVIKMYAWEVPFSNIVNLVRQQEVRVLTITSYVKGVILSSAVFIERTILFITIITYFYLGHEVTAEKVFSAAQFFNILQASMAIYYPMATSMGAETLVSIKRLQELLLLEEKERSAIVQNESKEIVLQNVTASWIRDTPVLKNINLKISAGSLCAIIGQVGSGKSSCLQLLLEELPLNDGVVTVGGTMSYSSQEAWLFASTVRKNILFGEKYDRVLYKDVVKVCALERDFELLHNNDQTMVGEKGVSLSGGQRARINLARAIYRNADIYLLDDPLSAVDTHVGKQLFDECIVRYLKNKTRILVTHQLQYLKKADQIVVINEGKIEAQGTFEELSKMDLDFTRMLVSSDETKEANEGESSKVVKRGSMNDSKRRIRRLSKNFSIQSEVSEFDVVEDNSNEEEVTKYGSKAYLEYAKASGNYLMLFGLLLLMLGGQISSNACDLWLTYWTEEEEIRIEQKYCTQQNESSVRLSALNETVQENMKFSFNETQKIDLSLNNIPCGTTPIDSNLAVYVYIGLIILSIILLTARALSFYKMAMIASQNLHRKMFSSLLQAPMRFFDTNPSGRILNRFSRDIGMIDEILPKMMIEAIQIFLVMAGILIMVFITNVYMIALVLILAIAFYKIRGWYTTVARNIKHLEGIAKSPVFSHLNSSIYGIITIRSAACQNVLIEEFDWHQDTHTSTWYIMLVSIAAFGLWIDFLSFIFITCTIFSFIAINHFGAITASQVGLALSQSFILNGMVQYGMRQTAELVSQMTSVERVLDYTKLKREGSDEAKTEVSPPETWPEVGNITFANVSLRYSDDELPVLRNLDFTVKATEKVGIVGRTGAGKSSLISGLFRLAPVEGSIIIDGIDTNNLSLHNLRRKISIIPQEPVLFSASLRYNLDPFDEFSDKDIWKVLEEVELKAVAASLEFFVQEGGSNFSVGQRQLICLARAILRKNKILVLDEATANVDPRTDELIQKTIRNKFQYCTVLTIAHRLHTIMDGDKVLVMDAGEMVEYDRPHLLLQDSESYLSKMVEKTGKSMSQHLHSVARITYMQAIAEEEHTQL